MINWTYYGNKIAISDRKNQPPQLIVGERLKALCPSKRDSMCELTCLLLPLRLKNSTNSV